MKLQNSVWIINHFAGQFQFFAPFLFVVVLFLTNKWEYLISEANFCFFFVIKSFRLELKTFPAIIQHFEAFKYNAVQNELCIMKIISYCLESSTPFVHLFINLLSSFICSWIFAWILQIFSCFWMFIKENNLAVSWSLFRVEN